MPPKLLYNDISIYCATIQTLDCATFLLTYSDETKTAFGSLCRVFRIALIYFEDLRGHLQTTFRLQWRFFLYFVRFGHLSFINQHISKRFHMLASSTEKDKGAKIKYYSVFFFQNINIKWYSDYHWIVEFKNIDDWSPQ
jgi:hypothetical protein